MDQITIRLECHDLLRLAVNRMRWVDQGWHEQLDRFYPVPRYDYAYAYWFADAVSMIVARSYLQALAQEHQVLTDECSTDAPYVILTNYNSE